MAESDKSTKAASDFLRSARNAHRYSCGCSAIDALLSPASSSENLGLAQGAVVELMGPPGIGKTRTALGFIMSTRFRAVSEDMEEGEVLVVG